MVTDQETNIVYFSELLKSKPYSIFWKRLEAKLKERSICYDFLHYTKDIWCRDYMPVQVSKNNFIRFKYVPVYPPWTDAIKVSKDIGIDPKTSDIKLDGGNVVKSRTKVIITERVVEKNKRQYSEGEITTRLKNSLGVKEVIIIPEDPRDPFGHADGMVRFCDGVKDERHVFVNDYSAKEAELKKSLYAALESNSLIPISMPYNPIGDENDDLDARGIYINYLQVGKAVFYPTYGLGSDKKAGAFFSKYFGSNAISVKANEVAVDGGILNCISWNICNERK